MTLDNDTARASSSSWSSGRLSGRGSGHRSGRKRRGLRHQGRIPRHEDPDGKEFDETAADDDDE